MSGRILYRPQAEDDLVLQFTYYLTCADQEVADRFLDAIDTATQRLLGMPSMGALRQFRNPRLKNIRMHPVEGFERHLIFYFKRDDGIEIVRVLHSARDLPVVMEE